MDCILRLLLPAFLEFERSTRIIIFLGVSRTELDILQYYRIIWRERSTGILILGRITARVGFICLTDMEM
jgi:hypothetical protein